jgi:L-asparaginase/Glu-tRNA(Gln) amidotransferase subunit D
MENRRKHFFPENDVVVITGLCPNGEYGATREDEDEGLIRGYGHSRLAAIADLVWAISNTEEEENRNAADYRTPFTGEDAAQWQADRRRSEEMSS